MEAIRRQSALDHAGFSVADHYQYLKIAEEFPEIESGHFSLVKEWEITQTAPQTALDLDLLSKYEKQIGDATLWNALIADRRIYHGEKCKFQQDYVPRFRHDRMLQILQEALLAIEKQFDDIQPDAVLALNAVTFCDYLYYLFAKRRGVPYLQLKLTRIENYISLFTDPFELSPHIYNAFKDYRNGSVNDDAAYQEAAEFYQRTRNKLLTYEGAIKLKKETKEKVLPAKNALGFLKNCIQYWRSPAYNDNHFPGVLTSEIHNRLIKPFRARRIQRGLRSFYTSPKELANHTYAFYPMHTEPEVALSVFGRPYQNQIETIRNIAMNLPVTWKLVVKDHPNAWGFRTVDYYKKILAIPNVLLIESSVSSQNILEHAKMVIVINGTIGLEAVMRKIPVITLGISPYYVFPESMVRHVRSIYDLSASIRCLLENYQFDESSIIAYIAAHIKGSVRANLFTQLLAKGGRTIVEHDRTVEEQFDDIATYTIRRVLEEKTNRN